MASDRHSEETIRKLETEIQLLRSENELYRKALMKLLSSDETEMTDAHWQELQRGSNPFTNANTPIEKSCGAGK
jgi:hypothetical protein